MTPKKLIGQCAAGIAAVSMAASVSAATIVLNNVDGPGLGLNDPTPATPIGGNPGTTVGEQRLAAFQFAADRWGATLESDVTVIVQASFSPLNCNATGGVLGAAGALQIFSDFPNANVPGTWYHVALANSLAGVDLTPGPPDPGLLVPPFNDDIVAFFNADLGSPGCLENSGWYYGFDGGEAPNEIDFLAVVTHEIGHGLGFQEFVDEGDGTGPLGLPDIYSTYMFDTGQGKTFAEMTPAERLQAQVAGDDLVWIGESVTAAAPSVLGPKPSIRILRPKSIKGTVAVQQASFGPSLTTGGGTTGQVVLADDGDDSLGSTTDGCEPIQNKLNGKIALIDRGGCAFVTKALNAQAAGAKGVMVANNQPGGPAPMGGFSPFVTIPSVGITLDQGNAFKDVGKANVKLILDPTKLSGANDDGFVQLYAPNPVQPGSSKSHWDTSATPNLLMEPSITPTLDTANTLDLTPNLYEDIGWVLK